MCRRLGYGTVKTITGPGGYGRGAGKIHFTQIRLVIPSVNHLHSMYVHSVAVFDMLSHEQSSVYIVLVFRDGFETNLLRLQLYRY